MDSKLLSLGYYPFFFSDKLEMQLIAQGLTTDLSGSSLLENIFSYPSSRKQWSNTVQAFTFSIFTELAVKERKYLLPMLSAIHCPTVSEEIWWTIADLQLNIFYHISPLKTLFAVEKATCLTSQEIKQSISSVCIDCMIGLISLYQGPEWKFGPCS